MARRLQFSLRTALVLVFVVALVAWPTTSWLRAYLAGLVPVNGRVTFKGQPLQDAKVVLVPTENGKSAEGVTDAAGLYELNRPLKPGQYDMSVTEMGTSKRGLSPKYADASTSGIAVFVTARGPNVFNINLSD